MSSRIDPPVRFVHQVVHRKKFSRLVNPVTYSLQSGFRNSEEYYRRVRQFTDAVLSHAAETLGPVVGDYMEYLRTYRLEEVRSAEEYILELLSFATLWNAYGGYARAIRRAPFITLARMAEWRKKRQDLKPAIDIVRGILITLFLLPECGAGEPASRPTLKDVDRLCLWLEATGEFREQALRFIRWRAFWDTMADAPRAEMGAAIFAFARWFVSAAESALGRYTTNVDEFLQRSSTRYRWREDRIQCTRARAEYHLNMVGAEIMNRAFSTDFRNTQATALLVPGCMRSRPDGECEAVKSPEGLRCNGCLPGCSVHRLREMGKRRGFDVYIIPHASDLSRWSPAPHRPRTGVVAAACVTTLVEGGWELKRYDAPAQCVMLEYSGCRKHWHSTGVPTSLNMRELKRILQNMSRPASA